VYFNNFENGPIGLTGFTAQGTLTSLTQNQLPVDAGGLSSPNQATWLGPLGKGVPKSPTTSERVVLSLNDLTPNAPYSVSFDLLIGGSWEGNGGCCGPDEWKLTASSGNAVTSLVDATFSNCGADNQLCGTSSPQSYSDSTPLAGTEGSFAPGTGADVFADNSENYSQDYDIYYFGHGEGNPILTFTPATSTASLIFERLPVGSGDSKDEYWALNNVLVQRATGNPVPTISSLTPSSVRAGAPDTTLTITGTNFIAASAVSFGSTALMVQSQTETELVVSVPAALLTTAGPITVTVTNPPPCGGSAYQEFTIKASATY
jgi:hypothetical protein